VGNAMLVKPLAAAMLHLKKCKEDTDQCKTCAQSAIQLSAAMTESMEVAELFRRLLATMPGGLPGVPPVPPQVPPR
jgi:hypothetical protein